MRLVCASDKQGLATPLELWQNFEYAIEARRVCFRCIQVLYGTTDLLTGEEFLHQLEELGRRSGIAPAAPPATT